MIKTAADIAADQAAAERKAQEQHCLDLIFRATPTVIRNQANAGIILGHLYEFTRGEVPTLNDWELMIIGNPSYITTYLARTTEEVRKTILVDQIMTLLRTKGPKMFEEDYRNEQKRLSLPQVTVAELEDKLALIRERQRLAGMTVAQIQSEQAAGRKQPTRVVLPVEYTVRAIKKLTGAQLSDLIRTYGSASVNDRLFGRS